MDDNNKDNPKPLREGDAKAIRNKHDELHSLLVFICQDSFKPFTNLSGEHQQGILKLARSASEYLGECLK